MLIINVLISWKHHEEIYNTIILPPNYDKVELYNQLKKIFSDYELTFVDTGNEFEFDKDCFDRIVEAIEKTLTSLDLYDEFWKFKYPQEEYLFPTSISFNINKTPIIIKASE